MVMDLNGRAVLRSRAVVPSRQGVPPALSTENPNQKPKAKKRELAEKATLVVSRPRLESRGRKMVMT
jgi:hypothetical protein